MLVVVIYVYDAIEIGSNTKRFHLRNLMAEWRQYFSYGC